MFPIVLLFLSRSLFSSKNNLSPLCSRPASAFSNSIEHAQPQPLDSDTDHKNDDGLYKKHKKHPSCSYARLTRNDVPEIPNSSGQGVDPRKPARCNIRLLMNQINPEYRRAPEPHHICKTPFFYLQDSKRAKQPHRRKIGKQCIIVKWNGRIIGQSRQSSCQRKQQKLQ